MDIKDVLNWKKSGLFAAGVLFGTAGIKVLSSKDAKNFYTSCTAAVLRAKDCVMKTATCVQENATDIYESAKQMNEERAAAEEAFEDVEDDIIGGDFKEETEELRKKQPRRKQQRQSKRHLSKYVFIVGSDRGVMFAAWQPFLSELSKS